MLCHISSNPEFNVPVTVVTNAKEPNSHIKKSVKEHMANSVGGSRYYPSGNLSNGRAWMDASMWNRVALDLLEYHGTLPCHTFVIWIYDKATVHTFSDYRDTY